MATPRVGNPKDFWKTLKSISVAEIAREANRPLSVAIVGDKEHREQALQALFHVAGPESKNGNAKTKAQALPETPFLQGFDAMTPEAGFPTEPGVFDFVIDVGNGPREGPEGTPIYTVADLGGWEATLERILDDKPALALPLARNFPVFRRRVAQGIIAQTATTNAQFALITGVAQAIPIAAIILPINSISDMVMLTKNQILMALRLAACYGLTVDYRSRMKELVPILGNAFGWRAVARELVGVIPGVGFLARATIAYAGTVSVGKAAQLYYETGETLTKQQVRKLYQEAYEASREKVRALAESMRGRGGGGGGSRQVVPLKKVTRAELTEKQPTIDLEPVSEQAECEPAGKVEE